MKSFPLDFGNSEDTGDHKENGFSGRVKLKSRCLWSRSEEKVRRDSKETSF